MEITGGDHCWRSLVEITGGDHWCRSLVEMTGGDHWCRSLVRITLVMILGEDHTGDDPVGRHYDCN